MIDLMELSNEITRFRSDDQYLKEKVDEFLNDAIELLQLVKTYIISNFIYSN